MPLVEKFSIKNRIAFGRFVLVAGLLAAIGYAIAIKVEAVNYNVPVCAHVDERNVYQVLFQFENADFDPKFFDYPALYMWTIYGVSQRMIVTMTPLLRYRVANFLLYLFYLFVAYAVVFSISHRTVIGLSAVLLLAMSEILTSNASYLSTDILMSVWMLLSILMAVYWLETNRQIRPILAFSGVFAGLGIGTKYTAVVAAVAVCIIVIATELTHPRSGKMRGSRLYLPSVILIFIISSGALIAYILFPYEFVYSLIKAKQGVLGVFDQRDVLSVEYLRSRILIMAIALFLAVIALHIVSSKLSTDVVREISIFLFVAVSVFLVTNPYVLLNYKQFVYDFGAQLRNNAMAGDTPMIGYYTKLYLLNESIVLLAVLVAGGLYFWRYFSLPVVTVAILIIVVGTATRGFDRYLTPIISMIIVFGASLLGVLLDKYKDKYWIVGLVALILLMGTCEMYIKNSMFEYALREPNEMNMSYTKIIELKPSCVYYTGLVFPYVELVRVGIPIRQWSESSSDWLSESSRGAILIVDRKRRASLDTSGLSLFWMHENGYGQYIYRAKNAISEVQ